MAINKLNKGESAIIIVSCMRCGCTDLKNFYMTKDPDRSYTGKIAYCKDCVKKIHDAYVEKYADYNMAVYYTCRKIDVPYIHSNYEGCIKSVNKEASKIKGHEGIMQAYMKGLSFSAKNGWGYTFDNSVGENNIETLETFEDMIRMKRFRHKPIGNDAEYETIELDSALMQQKWGNFSNEGLASLESEYMDWEDKLDGINDKSMELMVRQICYETVEIQQGRESGEDVDKKVKRLQALLASSGLVEKQTREDVNDIKIGMLITEIEKTRPIKPVDCLLDDVDGFKKMSIGILGSLCRTLGKENEYTRKFDELYGEYSLDVFNHIEEDEEEVLDIESQSDLNE